MNFKKLNKQIHTSAWWVGQVTNSRGETLYLKDKVKHEGMGDEVAIIEAFYWNSTINEYDARTDKGVASIDFLRRVCEGDVCQNIKTKIKTKKD